MKWSPDTNTQETMKRRRKREKRRRRNMSSGLLKCFPRVLQRRSCFWRSGIHQQQRPLLVLRLCHWEVEPPVNLSACCAAVAHKVWPLAKKWSRFISCGMAKEPAGGQRGRCNITSCSTGHNVACYVQTNNWSPQSSRLNFTKSLFWPNIESHITLKLQEKTCWLLCRKSDIIPAYIENRGSACSHKEWNSSGLSWSVMKPGRLLTLKNLQRGAKTMRWWSDPVITHQTT